SLRPGLLFCCSPRHFPAAVLHCPYQTRRPTAPPCLMPTPKRHPEPAPPPPDGVVAAEDPTPPADRGRGLRGLLRSYWTPAGRQALWNLVGLAFCTAVSQGLGFLGLIVLTNGLGPEGYAVVALAASTGWYLGVLGGFGLPPLVVRDLALRPAERD